MIEETIDGVGMDRLEVIDLEEGVEQDLDVALHRIALAVHETHLLRLDLLEHRRHRSEMREQRFGVRVFVDEDPIAEAFAAHRGERVLREVEVDEVALVAQVHQASVEAVGPAVVAADESIHPALALAHERCTAVPAGVVERTDDAVLVTHDEDR